MYGTDKVLPVQNCNYVIPHTKKEINILLQLQLKKGRKPSKLIYV